MYREKYYLWQFYFVKCDLEFLLVFFCFAINQTLSSWKCTTKTEYRKKNPCLREYVCVGGKVCTCVTFAKGICMAMMWHFSSHIHISTLTLTCILWLRYLNNWFSVLYLILAVNKSILLSTKHKTSPSAKFSNFQQRH